MYITFFIGNGFDLNLGLKTSYKDFYSYFKQRYPKNMIAKEINISDGLWADLELALGEFVSNCESESSFEDFLNAKDEMDLCLTEYLEIENKSFSIVDAKKLAESFKNGIINISSDFNQREQKQFDLSLNLGESHTYSFINFNYTDTLDRVIEKCLSVYKPFTNHKKNGYNYGDKLLKPIHIHGSLRENMILGVNDKTQIKTNVELSDYKLEVLVKSSLNDELGVENDIIVTNTINKSRYIFIYGMSIGETDKKWWDQLLKWLTSDRNRKLFYYKRTNMIENNSATAKIRAERKAKEELLKRLGYTLPTISKELLGRIVIVFNSSIFELEGVTNSLEKQTKELISV